MDGVAGASVPPKRYGILAKKLRQYGAANWAAELPLLPKAPKGRIKCVTRAAAAAAGLSLASQLD